MEQAQHIHQDLGLNGYLYSKWSRYMRAAEAHMDASDSRATKLMSWVIKSWAWLGWLFQISPPLDAPGIHKFIKTAATRIPTLQSFTPLFQVSGKPIQVTQTHTHADQKTSCISAHFRSTRKRSMTLSVTSQTWKRRFGQEWRRSAIGSHALYGERLRACCPKPLCDV